jgi:hypothetical protein
MTSSTWDPSTDAEVAYRTERARRAYAGRLERGRGWVRAAARQWWDLWVRGTAWVGQGVDRVGDTLDGVAAQHDGSWDEYVARRAAEIERGLDGVRPEGATR